MTFVDENQEYPRTLNGFQWAIEREKIDVAEIRLQIKNNEPSSSSLVFGNEKFVTKILKREGWLLEEPSDESKSNTKESAEPRQTTKP